MRQQIFVLSHRKDGVEVHEVNVQPDHVHVLLTIPPKYSVSDMMGYLKGELSLKLFDKYPVLRQKYWGRHLWSKGYCVSTVGLDEERIRKYVKWQNKKDKEASQQRLFD